MLIDLKIHTKVYTASFKSNTSSIKWESIHKKKSLYSPVHLCFHFKVYIYRKQKLSIFFHDDL